METKHTPARCENCKWVHEADSTKGTSYMGVELCPQHAAVPELLEALQSLMDDAEDTGEFSYSAMSKARAAIAKATS